MIIQLQIEDKKAKSFISFLKELDFVKIQPHKTEAPLTDADVIFGLGSPASEAQLKNYLDASGAEEAKDLNLVCEEVIEYLAQKKK